MTRPVLTITKVARRFGISTRTIRLYHEEGFIALERHRGRCLIRPRDVEAVAMIERLKADLGVNLAGVGVIIEMRRKIIDMQRRLAEMEAEFERRAADIMKLPQEKGPTALSRRGPRDVVKIEVEEE